MATLKWKFEQDGPDDVLVAAGEYSRDWQAWKEGQGYFGRAFIPFKGGVTLCVDLQIWGKATGRPGIRNRISPPSGERILPFSFGELFILDSKLFVRIPVQRCIELAEKQPKRYIRENLPGILTEPGVRYRVTIAVQVKEGPARPPSVSWEAGQPMTYSGGLPETNRRKH